jgi:hypothetical protein
VSSAGTNPDWHAAHGWLFAEATCLTEIVSVFIRVVYPVRPSYPARNARGCLLHFIVTGVRIPAFDKVDTAGHYCRAFRHIFPAAARSTDPSLEVSVCLSARSLRRHEP